MTGEDPSLVSVIVYCNARDGLPTKALESNARQTLADVEVLPISGSVTTATRNNAIAAARGRFVLELSEGDCLTHLQGVESAGDAAAQRWLRSTHRWFYAQATADRLIGGAIEGLRRRVPIVSAIPKGVAWKLEIEGVTNRRRALRHPVDAVLRLMSRALKGRLWRRLNLPARPAMWT